MNLIQHLRSFIGLESPSLGRRILAKKMVEGIEEAIHGKKEETTDSVQ
ncbi:Uncharacterised protein [Streptococcus pneumoniae]|nr:Uncharacterised protein [Streptococcus pneumoniae]